MPASSYLGTSLPGSRESLVASFGPGNGVGCEAAGNANVPFTCTMPKFFDAGLAGAPFSAAAPLLPSFNVLLFCWANNGRAKKALIARTRHNLRITFLPQRNSTYLVARSPLRVLEIIARRLSRHSALLQFLTRRFHQMQQSTVPVRLFHNSLSPQLFPYFSHPAVI